MLSPRAMILRAPGTNCDHETAHAFERAGARCVFSSDWDKFSRQTYAANFGEEPAGARLQTKRGVEVDVLEAADGRDDSREGRRDGVETSRPGRAAVGPRKPHGGLRLPFRRQGGGPAAHGVPPSPRGRKTGSFMPSPMSSNSTSTWRPMATRSGSMPTTSDSMCGPSSSAIIAMA